MKIGNDRELADYLERKVIEEDRSPAAALADIELEGRTFKTSICVSTFYSYIEKGVFLNLTNKDLPEKPKRKRPYHRVKTTKRAPRGESIEKRPEVINQRITFGHWEMDTVYSVSYTHLDVYKRQGPHWARLTSSLKRFSVGTPTRLCSL